MTSGVSTFGFTGQPLGRTARRCPMARSMLSMKLDPRKGCPWFSQSNVAFGLMARFATGQSAVSCLPFRVSLPQLQIDRVRSQQRIGLAQAIGPVAVPAIVGWVSQISPRDLADILNVIDELLLPYTVELSVFAALDHAKLREHIARVGQVFYERGRGGGEGQDVAAKAAKDQ
jgi:hypothetical protein